MPDDVAPAVQDSGSAADTTTTTGVDLSSPAVQAAIQAAAEAATKDLRGKVDEFRSTNVEMMKKLKVWEGLNTDPEKLKSIIENLSKNEETRLIAEGKFDEVHALRVQPLKDDYEFKLKARDERIDAMLQELTKSQSENFKLLVSNEVAAAASANPDVNPDAIPIFVGFANQVWRREDDGTMVPRRPNGARWISKDGKSDITFGEWIEAQREHFPSLFKSPQGAGGRGGPGKATQDFSQIANPRDRIEQWRVATGKAY